MLFLFNVQLRNKYDDDDDDVFSIHFTRDFVSSQLRRTMRSLLWTSKKDGYLVQVRSPPIEVHVDYIMQLMFDSSTQKAKLVSLLYILVFR